MPCMLTPSRGASPGNNWIDPPKRERKRMVNYAENEYFRNALKARGNPPQCCSRCS